MKKTIIYSLVFVLALACFLIAFLPAKFVWDNVLSPNLDVRKLGVNVQAVDGTIWQGKALIKYKSVASVVAWDIDALGLLSLTLPVELEVDSQAGQLNAELVAGMLESEVNITKADIDLAQLNQFVRRQRVTLAGNLFVKNLNATIEGQTVKQASGLASWSGGMIAYPAQRSVHERDMPPFQVKLETRESGEIYAGVRDSGGSMDVIEATLSLEGVGMVQVKRRLLDLADEHWPSNSKASDTVFKVKKMIY